MAILSDEQVEAIKAKHQPKPTKPWKKLAEMSDEERREYQRTSKARSRANAKTAVEKEKARLAGETVQAYWKRQVAALERTSTKKLAALRERENEVWSIIWFAESIMRGEEDSNIESGLLLLEDSQADMESIAKDGLVATEAAHARDRFWQDEDFMQQVARMNEPTKTFLRYGIVIGLPTSTAFRWCKFMSCQGKPVAPFSLNPTNPPEDGGA